MEATVVAAFRFALDSAVKATFLFAAGGAALLLLRRRPASARHLAGTLAVAAALAAPALSPVLPRVRLPLLPAVAAVPSRPIALDAPLPAAPARRSPPVEAPEPAFRAGEAAAAPSAVVGAPIDVEAGARRSAPAPRFALTASAMAALLFLWLAGAAVLFVRLAVGLGRVRRLARRSSSVDDPEWKADAGALGRALGLRRPVPLVWSEALPVAVAAGARRPVLILPPAARQWDAPRRRVVLLHELAHVARRDGIALLLLEASLAVYWFHPLAWILARRLRRDAERAADDRVLGSGTKPSVYAGHLLAIIRSLREAAAPALPAMGVARPSHFEERLRAILAPEVRRRPVTPFQAGGAVAAAFAAAVALAMLQPWTAGLGEAALPAVLSDEDAPPPELLRASRGAHAARPAAKTKKAPCPKAAPAAPARPAETFTGRVVLAAAEPAAGTAGKSEGVKEGKATYRRAWSLYQEGRAGEAAEAFAAAHAAGYRPDISAYNAACALSLAGDPSSAFEWLDRASEAGFDVAGRVASDGDLEAVRSDPRFEEWRKRLPAAADAGPEEAASAAKRLEELARRFPEDSDELFGLGKDFLESGRHDLAARAFELSARAGRRCAASLYNAACARSLAGDPGGALRALQRALETGFDDVALLKEDADLEAVRGEPRFAELVETAEALALPSDEGDWSGAAARYAEFAAAHPELGRAWFNLGYARLAADDAAGAVSAFEEALARKYRVAATMYDLACSNARLGRKDEAFAYLFESLHRGFEGEKLLKHGDEWKALRGDPRFEAALALARTERETAD